MMINKAYKFRIYPNQAQALLNKVKVGVVQNSYKKGNYKK
ncbi:UNVERIFIED_CONTAM: helix-turn-helix domain-containing protein [Bacillus cereus]